MKSSLHTVKNHDNHRIRRRAWDKGFSIKGVSNPTFLSFVAFY